MQFVKPFYAPVPGQGGLPDAKNLQEVNDELARMRDTLTSVGESFRNSLTNQINRLPRAARAAAKDFSRDFTGALSSINAGLRQTERQANAYNKNLRTSTSIQRQIESTIDAQNELIRSQTNLQNQGIVLSAQQVREFNDANKEASDLVKYLQQQYDIQKKNEDQMNSLKEILTGISRIPILGSLIGAPKIIRAMEDAASKGASKIKQFYVGFDQLLKNIGSGLLLGAVTSLLSFVVKAVLDFDKKSFEIAKNLGVTANKAKELQSSFQNIAASSANIALTSSQVARTYEDFSNTAGFLVPTNKEFLETATKLQKQLGLSGQQLNTIATQAALSGKSFKQAFVDIEATRIIEGARNKLALSTKQIVEAIGRTSSEVLVNFKGSTTALSAAVVRAAKLGTTLDEVNKQARSLVDFESSIQAEFEAQVLTGENLNLTRARELALLGKTAELMEELNRQNVTFQRFNQMTLIEKDAFSRAIGKSTEELSKQLLEQERANKLGAEQGVSLQEQYSKLLKQGKTREQIAGLLDKEVEAELNKAELAARFNATIERLKDKLGEVLEGPLGGIIDKFTMFVNDNEKMNKLALTLKGIFEGIASAIQKLPQYLSTAVQIAKILATISIVRAVASVVGSLSTVPVVGAIAGIYAGYQAYNWLNGLMSGVAGSPPSVSAPSAPSTGMSPMNTATETAKKSNEGAAATESKPPVFNFNVTAQIGNENLSRITRAAIQQDPGTNMV
jgi:xanthosine utilization system XapX-like protein